MKKSDAVSLFGTVPVLAEVLGKTPQAIYQWGDELNRDQALIVVGAAYLSSRRLPPPSSPMFDGVIDRRQERPKRRKNDTPNS
jgi:hypothetical protein